MPITKDALARYRVIDRLLSDPNHNYKTEEILKNVNRECSEKVSLRMIQKDIKALEEEFGKKMIRNAGGRGTVRYEDQSDPLFYQELTNDEAEVLKEALKTIGKFEGLDNFTWLDLLKKKLDVKFEQQDRPLISFGVNNILQVSSNLLARLFTAISRRKVIRIKYAKFGKETKSYDVYPYQLRQYNNRWFLVLGTVETPEFAYDPSFITVFALDRMEEDFEYLDDLPFLDTVVDLNQRFNEIIGVTYRTDKDVEDIYFAVNPERVNYVRTKWFHSNQIELEGEALNSYRNKYPSLRDWFFFSIECRPNNEMNSLFASFDKDVVVLEPDTVREEIKARIIEAAENYKNL